MLFSFPGGFSDGDAAEMRSQVAAWPEAIGGMTRLRFGADLTGARSRGYSRLLFMEFDSEAELAAYQGHPVHQAFHRWIVEHGVTPLAFDYLLDGDTVLMAEGGDT